MSATGAVPPREALFRRRLADALAKRPFSIGLQPAAAEDWIEVDEGLAEDLALKATILGDRRELAFQALAGTKAIQAEACDLLVEHLLRRFPATYARDGDAVRVLPADRIVALCGEPPLLAVSRLVQEDLALLRRDAEGWTLVAASLCFPSTWSLSEKIGGPLGEVHAPVPGYRGQMAERVARIFDALHSEALVERFNLSIYGDGELRHSERRQAPAKRFPADRPVLANAHVRLERQTLRRLARSGAILFTIRVHLGPLRGLAGENAILAALREDLAGLTSEQLAYKGLTEARERLLDAISALAGEGRAAYVRET
jgi:hypothetical protein